MIELATGQNLTFKDPNNGNDIIKIFPTIDYVVSNLPFIKSKEIEVLTRTLQK